MPWNTIYKEYKKEEIYNKQIQFQWRSSMKNGEYTISQW